MANRSPSRRLRVVFREIDPDLIRSRLPTEIEAKEISAFFKKLRAENAKDPEIVALLEKVAQRYPKH